jgi:UDP-2-acetamido-3-amino-2,3-dideoxy-glucuronate N-acetyltransferase
MHRINIGKGATIGAELILVGPVNIGEFAMIGAESVVTKDIPSYSLAVGNPAKIVGSVNDKGTKTS